MAKKPKTDKRFLSDIDEDEIVGGGIPDEDGWIYLQRSGEQVKKQPKTRPKGVRKKTRGR